MRHLFLSLLLFVLAIQPLSAQTTTAVLKGERLEQAATFLTERLKAHGATDIKSMHSDLYLMIRFKGLTDSDLIRKTLGGKRVEFRYRDEQGNWQTALTNADLNRATAKLHFEHWSIEVETTEIGKEKLKAATERLVGKHLYIFVDDKEISDPVVREAITGGEVMITGNFTKEEANDMAQHLNAKAELLELSSSER
jgi:hypothetical protein